MAPTPGPSSAQAAPSWRHFAFFSPSSIASSTDDSSPPLALSPPHSLSAIASGQSSVLTADLDGAISILNASYDVTRTWTAYEGGRCTLMRWSGIKGVLATVGEEGSSSFPILKVWNLRHRDKDTAAPQLLGFARVSPSSNAKPHPVSVLALTPTLSYLALGLADGSVLLYKHLDQSLASAAASTSKSPLALPKPKLVHSSSDPVTGLGFRLPNSPGSVYLGPTTAVDPTGVGAGGGSARHTSLFIVTTSQTLILRASSSSASALKLDDLGASLSCSYLHPSSGDLIVARDEALYVYGTEGRGACLAYEGGKSKVVGGGEPEGRYLVWSSPTEPLSAASRSATVRNFANRAALQGPNGGSGMVSRVTVFDLENKFVAFSGTFEEGVRDLWWEWGSLYVLSDSGELTRLEEKPTSSKLELLMEKYLFQLAINVARSSASSSTPTSEVVASSSTTPHKSEGVEAEVARIYTRWGDHLYAKGEWDAAVASYVKTIGWVQPSFIIRKFIDAQRIGNLATYLQEVHERGVANADHTTLLLNCYTKLKDHDRLDRFIKASSSSSSGTTELPFDLDTAIRVCRQAGYFEHALYLAKQYSQDEEVLRILVEDLGRFKEGVEFIRSLSIDDAEENLVRYGKQLMTHAPEATTSVLVDLCCGNPLAPPIATSATVDDSKPSSSYFPLLSRGAPAAGDKDKEKTVDGNEGLRKRDLARVAQSNQYRKSGLYNPGLEASAADSDGATAVNGGLNGSTSMEELPRRPSLRQFFAFFVDHPQEFVRFLETVAEKRWGESVASSSDGAATETMIKKDKAKSIGNDDEEDREAVWGTLLELYLQLSADSSPAVEDATRAKALTLLKAHGRLPYDVTQALIVCTTHAYVDGIVLLYERLGMVDDILRFWINQAIETDSQAASAKVIETLDRYGASHPHLYPMVLRFLTSSGPLLDRHSADLAQVLKTIEEEKIMPSIAVVQTLARSGVASIGTIKEYLLRQITAEKQEIDSDRALVDSYRKETSKKRQVIAELSSPTTPQIFQVSRCSSCGDSLYLPAIHFMCKHSYHQKCLQDESECPTCARSHGLVREIRRNNEHLAGRHDLFLEEVQEADDGFGQIASAFSKGLLALSGSAASALAQ